MANDAREYFLALCTKLRQRRSIASTSESIDEDDALRLRASDAFDACTANGIRLQNDEVDVRLLRPPWSSRRLLASLPPSRVGDARSSIVTRRPDAAAVLKFLDMRSKPLDPYRRLGEQRHQPWACAACAAAVAAVQRARAAGHTAPRVLVAEGSLGADAAVAAAAGGRVCVCEPNPFSRNAIRKVAALHGVSHAVHVIDSTIEATLADTSSDEGNVHVVLLSPLLEEAALGRRLLPAAAAARKRAVIVVPERVHVHAALALLTAGCCDGVDLTPLDSTRWTPYPTAWAPHREEAASLLTDFANHLFTFELQRADDANENGRNEVAFAVDANLVAAANSSCGGEGGREWSRCNAAVLDVTPDFGAAANVGRLPAPQKRAVHFLEPFIVRANSTVDLLARHDSDRISITPPAGAKLAPYGAAEGWGTLLLQHWHFAMVRDAPRNDAYAAAISRAASAIVSRPPSAQTTEQPMSAIDMGSGSGLLSLMLARSMRKARGGDHAPIMGVECVKGVAELGNKVVDHNGFGGAVMIVPSEGHALMAQATRAPPGARPNAPLLIAELMDSGGLGEGLLPLAYEAKQSGLIRPDAQLLPCRLRVWVFVAELSACGTALDSGELVPSSLRGVRLDPWMAFREMSSYASVDLSSAQYTPLTDEVRLFEHTLGEVPPADAALKLAACTDGVANAVIWTWEVDLDDSGLPSAHLSTGPRAPRTHWRQSAQLLSEEQTLALQTGQSIALSFKQLRAGRELKFEVSGNERSVRQASLPNCTRPHAPKWLQHPPTEPRADHSLDTAAAPAPLEEARILRTGGRVCGGGVSRRAECSAHRVRRPRLRTPQQRVPIDQEWKAEMKAATAIDVNAIGLGPRGAAHSGRLSGAALEIAASPGRYGVHPLDGLQAVRMYYAA